MNDLLDLVFQNARMLAVILISDSCIPGSKLQNLSSGRAGI